MERGRSIWCRKVVRCCRNLSKMPTASNIGESCLDELLDRTYPGEPVRRSHSVLPPGTDQRTLSSARTAFNVGGLVGTGWCRFDTAQLVAGFPKV